MDWPYPHNCSPSFADMPEDYRKILLGLVDELAAMGYRAGVCYPQRHWDPKYWFGISVYSADKRARYCGNIYIKGQTLMVFVHDEQGEKERPANATYTYDLADPTSIPQLLREVTGKS